MVKDNTFTRQSFEMLLAWLDRDNRETAGQKYEKIRQRLIRIFLGRGCFEAAEELADETINRVALKLPQITENYVGEPVHYFYGVAGKIHLEWLRKQKKTPLPLSETDDDNAAARETKHRCLTNCLKKLPAEQHRLIVEYYGENNLPKVENRRSMAAQMQISVNALQVKAHRIRAQLKICLQDCVNR